jgi:hypothetical protein
MDAGKTPFSRREGGIFGKGVELFDIIPTRQQK